MYTQAIYNLIKFSDTLNPFLNGCLYYRHTCLGCKSAKILIENLANYLTKLVSLLTSYEKPMVRWNQNDIKSSRAKNKDIILNFEAILVWSNGPKCMYHRVLKLMTIIVTMGFASVTSTGATNS